MDKDTIKGKLKDMEGRIQRQAGEWTGNEKNQAEGAMKQGEGKLQEGAGKMKDAVRDAAEDLKRGNRDDAERDKKERDAA